MKKLMITIVALGLFGANAAGACVIKGKLKKLGAKTVYFANGEKVSLTQLNKIESCKLDLSVMSPKERLKLDIERYEDKLKKMKQERAAFQ